MIKAGIPRQFALLVGAFLIVEGVLELNHSTVFGVFATNTTHGVIHLVLGIVGLLAALKGRASQFLTFLGALLLLVGVLWFIPPTRSMPENFFNVNRAVAIFNVILGGVSLLVARDGRRHVKPGM